MAIRIRSVDGKLVALCAARSHAKEGDLYLDDGEHGALAAKFWDDYKDYGPMPIDAEANALRVQEEDNVEAWNKVYGEYARINKVGIYA